MCLPWILGHLNTIRNDPIWRSVTRGAKSSVTTVAFSDVFATLFRLCKCAFRRKHYEKLIGIWSDYLIEFLLISETQLFLKMFQCKSLIFSFT
jgi:hypothetical protein